MPPATTSIEPQTGPQPLVSISLLTFSRLELGAGGGLVGLAVALGCDISGKLLLTDQENMISLMEQNVKLNNLESRVSPLVLNWHVSHSYA